MRLSRCEVRDHIKYRKNDRWRSYRFYRALQRLKSPMSYICEIFGAPRFSSFSTQSAQLGHGAMSSLSPLSRVKQKSDLRPVRSVFDPQQNSRSGCLFFRTAHECSITTRCLQSPAGRIESWRRGAGSRSPTIGRYALR